MEAPDGHDCIVGKLIDIGDEEDGQKSECQPLKEVYNYQNQNHRDDEDMGEVVVLVPDYCGIAGDSQEEEEAKSSGDYECIESCSLATECSAGDSSGHGTEVESDEHSLNSPDSVIRQNKRLAALNRALMGVLTELREVLSYWEAEKRKEILHLREENMRLHCERNKAVQVLKDAESSLQRSAMNFSVLS